jgi:cytoskeletal protein RodZ
VSALTPVERTERRRQQRRRELIRWGIRILIVVLVFSLGVALGQAIQDNPNTGRTVTSDRTLHLPTAGNPVSTITP